MALGKAGPGGGDGKGGGIFGGSSGSSDVSKFNRRKGQDNYRGDKKSLVDNEVKKLFRK